jgi:hypothetical protein
MLFVVATREAEVNGRYAINAIAGVWLEGGTRSATAPLLEQRLLSMRDGSVSRCWKPPNVGSTRRRMQWPALGFKDFDCARVILSGIELMNMIKKGLMKCRGKTPLSPTQQFYSLVS